MSKIIIKKIDWPHVLVGISLIFLGIAIIYLGYLILTSELEFILRSTVYLSLTGAGLILLALGTFLIFCHDEYEIQGKRVDC